MRARLLVSVWSPYSWLALALPLFAGAALMAASYRRWLFDVRATEGWWSLSLIVVMPLCAATAAFLAVRRARTGLAQLGSTATRTEGAQNARLLIELGALIAVGLTPLFAATAGLLLHGASFGLPRPAVPLAVVGWCLAGCALGLALGRRFPGIAIAPAAGVAVYVFLVVPIYFPSLAFVGRLTPFGATSSAYEGPTPMYALLQCGAGIAVAAGLLPRSSSRRATTLAACAALSLVALNGPSAEHIDSRATRVTCKESSAFTLCLTCPRERDRARLSSILATAFGRLAPLYPPTTTIVHTVASDNAPAPAGSTPVLSNAAVGLPLETGDTLLPSDPALLAQVLYRLSQPAPQKDWERMRDGPPPSEVLTAWAYSASGISPDGSACPWDCYQLPGPEEAGRAEFARSLAWLGSRTDAQRRDWLTAHRPSILNGTLAYSDFT